MKTLNKTTNLHKLEKIIKEEVTKFLSELDLNTPEVGIPEDQKIDNVTELGTRLIKMGNLIRAGKILNLDKTEIEQLSGILSMLFTKASDKSAGATLQRINKYSKAQFPESTPSKNSTK
jgi:ribosome-interacting GTPase 1